MILKFLSYDIMLSDYKLRKANIKSKFRGQTTAFYLINIIIIPLIDFTQDIVTLTTFIPGKQTVPT